MNIRNFVIIAHIDHGKSTLADRFLELTKSVDARGMRDQFLDQMDLEREKGITIKMQPVRMRYESEGTEYLLNLIDTPGHADFSYEVSRSLAAVEGAVLLVDATKGVQAQTLANVKTAQKQNLVIIPAVNKIDSPLARTEEVADQVGDLLGVPPSDVFRVSAKTGANIPLLLRAVIERVPPPGGSASDPFRALIFDSVFDHYKGVIAYVRVVDGEIREGDPFILPGTKARGNVKEVGAFFPAMRPSPVLKAGEIGYAATGIKEEEALRIGDTLARDRSLPPLQGFQIPKPMVFTSFYPEDPNSFDALKDAMERLHLNDPSFSYDVESKEALGRGFRCGFLGVLHSEIISERIQREYGISLVISRPSVEYRIAMKRGGVLEAKTPADWPDPAAIAGTEEPWVRLEVMTPQEFFPPVLQALEELEGNQLGIEDLGGGALVLAYEVPMRELVSDFYDRLKSRSRGMASLDYRMIDWRPGDLVKLELLVAKEREEALAVIVPRHRAEREGRKIVQKLKDSLPAQQFEVPLQAAVGGRIVARETIRARRKDVTASLYGGDVTRKRKLLEKQKKGKKDLRTQGKVRIPTHVFYDVFRTS